MNEMFRHCEKLIEIDLSNFNTSNVIDMFCMFADCIRLNQINLSNFDTSIVTTMHGMFYRCNSLISLDLSNFITSEVIDMQKMFTDCNKLVSLNLSNFDTSNVEIMHQMFYKCKALVSVNLSNFDFSNVQNYEGMFSDCSSLKYISLLNFNQINPSMFDSINNKVIIFINDRKLYDIFLSKLESKACFILISNDWITQQNTVVNGINDCIESCDNNQQYKYQYNGKCYENCSNGYLLDNENSITNICKCELDKCLYCPPVALSKGLCTKCNNDYYQMENDPSNIGEYFNCYTKPKGYYLDGKDLLYKKCYFTCDECEIKGDIITHNCLKCNSNYSIGIVKNNYTNCYENSLETTIIIKKDIKNIIKDIIKSNNETEIKLNKEEEIKYYDLILDNIENSFISEDYDTSDLDNGNEQVIETEQITITFTTTNNQKNNINNNNMTVIDLGECEILLRKYYNISNNETLYMKKIDRIQEGLKITKVEYDVYSKLSGTILQKLNLSVCQNTKISLSVPIKLNENLDIFNTSSGYYNDICYTAKSESGTDILLKDRKDEFIKGNKTVCQDDCDFTGYNYTTTKAKCSCKVKESSKSFEDMNIDQTKLFMNFNDIKNYANFNILICYKNLFNSKGIKKNIGCYIIIIIIIFQIICFFIFYIKQFDIIINKVKEIISAKKSQKKGKKKTKKNKNLIMTENQNEKQNDDNNQNRNHKLKSKKLHKRGNNYISFANRQRNHIDINNIINGTKNKKKNSIIKDKKSQKRLEI